MVLRDAGPEDRAEWERLWEAYLSFYGKTLAPGVTASTWARALDPKVPLGLILAEATDGSLSGFATYVVHPSTWVAGDDIYLEDLYVDAAARGQGLGRALINTVARRGRGLDCTRLYWMADEGNATARRLYETYARPDGHLRYRFDL
ncbi:GNAT family N-acetyltransferase [Frigidibacter sp. MR17.14]|uniref:GNAT family N-acetyltransferase n=1 Tax=Frigidibacter sp. MR17.14 TaxID=3126509 RepID=UPI00301302C8